MYMYKTTWSDKEKVSEEIQSFVSLLEKRFVNTDGQIQVSLDDNQVHIEFEVFNLSSEETQELFNSVEKEVQTECGYSNYTMKTDSSVATVEVEN